MFKKVKMINSIGKTLPLISVFGRHGKWEDATDIFNHFCSHSKPTVSLFSALTSAYLRSNVPEKAAYLVDGLYYCLFCFNFLFYFYIFYCISLYLLNFIIDMKTQNIFPDRVCFLLMAQACAQIGNAKSATILFWMVQEKKINFLLNIIEYTQLLKALCDTQFPKLDIAFKVVSYMYASGIQPDAQLYVPLLLGCAKTLSLLDGEQVHTQIINNRIKIDTRLGNSLINMYGKCGQTIKAMNVFQQMKGMGVPQDTITWTIIIQILNNIEEGIQIHHQLMV